MRNKDYPKLSHPLSPKDIRVTSLATSSQPPLPPTSLPPYHPPTIHLLPSTQRDEKPIHS